MPTNEAEAPAAQIPPAQDNPDSHDDELVASPFPIRVAIIDDGVVMPTLRQFDDPAAAQALLSDGGSLEDDLASIAAPKSDDPETNLVSLLESGRRLTTLDELAQLSDSFRDRWSDYLFCRELRTNLEDLVDEVVGVDPFADLPNLSAHDLVFLDFYLEDPNKGSALAEEIARNIVGQPDRTERQQIILMSNREGVAEERRTFRQRTDIRGASFAFVPKSELSPRWKVYSHLAVLNRARPLAPKIDTYHDALAKAVKEGASAFLDLVHQLDIDDYAHLQNVALMKDGDPLGEYIAALFAAELAARTVEADDVRAAERELDETEFEGKPFASSEPSTIVKQLYHSALICKNVGALADHPRAAPDGPYAGMPLVRMGDLFFTSDKDQVAAVMSADCDLAFAPNEDRPPNPSTAVLLVPGTTEKLAGGGKVIDAVTEGLVDGEEVFRINWAFANYRSVTLAQLQEHLEQEGFDVTRRDRLRAPFSFRLQQEFGANLFRVGTPSMPPVTRETPASVLLFRQGEVRERAEIAEPKLRLTAHKNEMKVRLTISDVETLHGFCEQRLDLFAEAIEELGEGLDGLNEGQREALEKKIASLETQREVLEKKLLEDEFWHSLHGDHLISRKLGPLRGIAKLVLGDGWEQNLDNEIVLQVHDPAKATVTD